jgi:hypothetical protein
MSNVAELLREYAEGEYQSLEALEAGLTADGSGADDEALTAWLGDALEFSVLGSMGSEGWEVTGWEVLTTYGGPNFRVSGSTGSASLKIHGAWGSDEVTLWAWCPVLAALLNEMAEASATR